jgi:chromosomal replication initiation ATPase DnaA
VQLVAASAADHDRDADLAAAVDAARRLRHVADVQQIVAAAGLTLDQVRGHGRRREEVEVRRIVAAYLLRRRCSLPEIGRVLNRDHTSVPSLLRTAVRLTGLDERTA